MGVCTGITSSYSPGKISQCRMCCHCDFISCSLEVCTKTKSHVAHVACLDSKLVNCDATMFILLSYVFQNYQNFEFHNEFIRYQLSQVAEKFSKQACEKCILRFHFLS